MSDYSGENAMVELLTQPPPLEAIAKMTAIDGVRIAPTVLATQRGPDGHLGPEAAGAVLILQATFVDEDRAAEFWLTAAGLMERLAAAPGFIRRFNFADGPHYTLVALWRTTADAHAFFASDEHQTAMRELFRHRWQYSHFAALWEMTTPRQRVIFCQQCDGVTPATEAVCAGCGTELFDPFAVPSQSHAGR
jgi:heme-degrading monooxygenase HmoA